MRFNVLVFFARELDGDELASGGERAGDERWKSLLVVFWWLVHLKCQCEDDVKEN